MKRFLTKRDLKFKKKQAIYACICIILVVGLYFIFNRKEKPVVERPIVCVQPVVQENVEIYGDYVGRIRAQLFVEVRARVDTFCHQSGPIPRKSRQGQSTIEERRGYGSESQT